LLLSRMRSMRRRSATPPFLSEFYYITEISEKLGKFPARCCRYIA
jgi:hypothetical protein